MKKKYGIMAMTFALTVMMSVLSPASALADTVVRTNIGSEPDNLNPWLSAASDTDSIFRNVFDGLVRFDETGKIIPCLAESWDISDDGLTYTFHLRDDVTFHNGKAMSAEDVLYTYESLSGLGGEDPLLSTYTVIKSLDAPDDYTVVMTLDAPDSSFLQMNRVAVLPKGYDDQSTQPVGAGPFVFEKYIPGQEVILKKNENYYDESRSPKIDEAEIYIMTDESAVLTAMQSGQLDLATVYADNAEYLRGDFEVMSSPQNMVQLLALNNNEKPFDDIRVRQALNYCIDKDQIIDGVFSGYATKLDSNFSPVMAVYYNDELGDVYKPDLEKAKELLKEAGYADGFEMTITVPSNYQKHVDTAIVIVEQLKALNIKATLNLVDWGTWLEDVYTNAKYQSTIIGLTGKLDPAEILIRYTTGYRRNFINFSNEDYDALMKEAREGSVEDSVEKYKECQKILTEEAASVYISDPHAIVVARSDLKGYTFYPVTFLDLCKLYYEE